MPSCPRCSVTLKDAHTFCPRCGRSTDSTLPTQPQKRCTRCQHQNPCFAARCAACGHERLRTHPLIQSKITSGLRAGRALIGSLIRIAFGSFNRVWITLGLYLAPIVAHLLYQLQRADLTPDIKNNWLWVPAGNWFSLLAAGDSAHGPPYDHAPLLAALCAAFLVLWIGAGFILRYHIRSARR